MKVIEPLRSAQSNFKALGDGKRTTTLMSAHREHVAHRTVIAHLEDEHAVHALSTASHEANEVIVLSQPRQRCYLRVKLTLLGSSPSFETLNCHRNTRELLSIVLETDTCFANGDFHRAGIDCAASTLAKGIAEVRCSNTHLLVGVQSALVKHFAAMGRHERRVAGNHIPSPRH